MDVQAAPNPFTRVGCRAVLEPIHSEQLLVGSMPEAAYIQQKQGASQDSYMVDKQESANEYAGAIMSEHAPLFTPGGAPDNTFSIRTTWTHWEPGFVGFVSKPSIADFLVDVVAANGQLLDRFDFETAVGASLYNPSSGGRMRSALKRAGHVVAAYINDNWLCASH
jgi:hypothetical protein